jgi:uncharacterized protein (DUF4415 family)
MAIVKYRLDPVNPPQLTEAQKRRLDAMTDADIDYSDIPPLSDEFFERAIGKIVKPEPKQLLTIRIDMDVLKWLRSFGRGYHTRINHILRAAMETSQPAQVAREAAAGAKPPGRVVQSAKAARHYASKAGAKKVRAKK